MRKKTQKRRGKNKKKRKNKKRLARSIQPNKVIYTLNLNQGVSLIVRFSENSLSFIEPLKKISDRRFFHS